jgi:ankyrin repeat protein
MEAAKQGNPQSIKLIMDKVAGLKDKPLESKIVNAQDNSGRTALMEAAAKGNKDTAQVLIGRKDLAVDLKDDKGRTALVHAARGGNPELVKSLLNKGADPNIADQDGSTALMEAAKAGLGSAVESLVKAKNPPINLNLQDKDGRTALIDAVAKGDVRSVKALLDGGARQDIKDADGDTALSAAKSLLKTSSSMQKEFEQIVKLLDPTGQEGAPQTNPDAGTQPPPDAAQPTPDASPDTAPDANP